ncbi:MAG: mechanosensitive ion channel [Synergistaceae bacterium]|nr:mechanosensitive ion channel [Synergistaceae bacterium]
MSFLKTFALLSFLCFFTLFHGGASYAGDLAGLVSLRILTEAEALRYGRIMRESRELIGELMSVEETRRRVAELSDEAQSRRDAVKYLINLYTVYLSALQNLNVSPAITIPKFGEDSHSGTFSITYYDELREEYARLLKSMESCRLALKAHADNLHSLTAEYAKQRALAASSAENTNNPEEQLETERIFVALSLGYVRMEVELSYSRAVAGVYERMAEQLGNTRENIRFTKEDLDPILSGIQEIIAAREAELPITIDRLARIGEEISGILQPELYASLRQDFLQRQAALYRSAGDSPARAKTALLAAGYTAERLRLHALMIETRILLNMTALWRTRHDIFTGETAGEALWNARSDTRYVLEQVDKDEQFIRQNLENIQSNYFIVEALTRRADAETDGILHQILDVFAEIQMHMYSKAEMTIRAQRLLATGIVDELEEKIGNVRLARRAAKIGRDLIHTYKGKVLWRGEGYEVTAYDLTLAVSTLLIGLLVSSLLSRLTVRAVAYRRSIDSTFLMALQRIMFYLFALLGFMLALDVINVPLTAFAFAGGAVTLAVGFGAKVVFSNQISGMMILFNRSFRHGDIIEIDGTAGAVEEIGTRATRVYAFDGTEIMLPNSYFMEHKIINYTKSGPKKRNSFKVRVAGGCDPEETGAVLAEAVKNYRNPTQKKEPFIVLADFSLRSIDFDVYYWYDCKKESPLRVAGQLRKEILLKLREREIKLYDPHERVLTK